MPQLGETVAEGTVTTWFKDVGDTVAVGEALFEVTTDKVDTEVPSTAAGVLREILVGAGETVPVGTALAVVGDAADAPPATQAPAAATGAPPGRPDHAPTAAPVSVPAPQTPAPPVDPPTSGGAGFHPVPVAPNTRHRASPLVRRLLRERGLSEDDVSGTGPGGRILRADLDAVDTQPAAPAADATPAAAAPAGEPAAVPDDVEVVPFSRVRRRTAEHMVRSRATSPHAFMAVEVDFHAVDQARRSPAGQGLSYLPFVARAVVSAIGAYPHVNAQVGDDALLVHRRVHLGIAVDLDADGLVVPVVRHAGDFTVPGLGRRIAELAAGARERRLGADDYAGGTFTISNPGPYGTLLTAPIINQPQVAILATDTVKPKPVAVATDEGDYAIAVHPVGTIGLSFDHRVVDGGYAARFLRHLQQQLETRNWPADL